MTAVTVALAFGVGVLVLLAAGLAAQRNHQPTGASVLRLPTDAGGRHLVISDADGVSVVSADGLPTLAVFSAPEHAELEIVLEREEIRPFKFLANLVELKVRVRNLTDRPKRLDRWGWTIQVGDVEPDTPPFWDADAMREAHEAAERQHTMPSKLGPLDTMSGWIATAIPHEVSGRVGAYNVYAKDELGATYILLMPRRGGGNLWPT